MKDIVSTVMWILASGCLTACVASGDSPEGSHVPVRLDVSSEQFAHELETFIPRVMAEARIPGLGVAVVRDGTIVWTDTFGVKSVDSGEPVTAETVFEAASLTKPLVAYAAMKMVDEGLLGLDTPLVDYIPARVIEESLLHHSLDHPEFRREWFHQVTLRHVLSHSAGLPHGESGEPLPIFFQPGTAYKYSASGYHWLQLALESLKGHPLRAIADEYVFRPLNMGDSSLVWRDDYERTCANGHDEFGRTHPLRRYEKAHAAASLYTTATDYARFVCAVLNGDGLSRRSATEMTSPQIEVGDGHAWSLGFGLQRDSSGEALWQWGDYGIYRHFTIAYQPQKTAVVYLTNSSHGLSICEALVDRTVGGGVDALDSLGYERFDTPVARFTRLAIEDGARAITEVRTWPSAHRASIDEQVVNGLGYRLLGARRFDDAIRLFRWNTEEHATSANTFDSLAEAYATRNAEGDLDLAIDNYRRVRATIPIDPNPDKSFLRRLTENAENRLGELHGRRGSRGRAASAPQRSLDERTQESIEAYVQGLVDTGYFSGVVLIAQGADIVFQRAAGYADHELRSAMATDTVFDVASITKTFTGHAIRTLAAEGVLDLSQSVAAFVPELPSAEQIVLLDLLGHRSGIGNVGPEVDLARRTSLRELISILAEAPLQFAPGTGTRYSNGGYAVLARVIELASGRPYGEFLHDRIFLPRGMSATSDREFGVVAANRATGYVPAPAPARVKEVAPINPDLLRGSGSVQSTPDDLLRWAEFVREKIAAGAPASDFDWGGQHVAGEIALSAHGACNGYMSSAVIVPHLELSVVILVNIENGEWTRWAGDLAAIVAGGAVAPPKLAPTTELARADLGQHVGRFVSGSTTVHVRDEEGHLWMYFGDWPIGKYLRPIGEGRFDIPSDVPEVEFAGRVDGLFRTLRWGGPGNMIEYSRVE